MRKVLYTVCAVLFSVLFLANFLFTQPTLHAFAEETEVTATNADGEDELKESIEQLISDLDTDELQDYLNSLEEFPDWNVKNKLSELLNGGSLDYSDVFAALFSVVGDSVADMLPAFAVIVAIALLCGVLNTLKTSFLKDSTSEIIFFVCYAAVAAVLFSALISVFSLTYNTMNGLKRQMEVIFPLLLTLMAAGGGAVSATVYQPAVAFLCGGVADILTEIVVPFTAVIIVLHTTSHFHKSVKLNGFISFFKSANKWLIGIGVTVFGIFLSAQGLTVASYDGISLRAAKYAISNSIPIVGNFISGGFDIVLAGNVLIKNSVGMLGVFLIVAAALRPIVTMVGFSLFLRFTAAVCEPIGDERISKFLTQIGDSVGYLVACLFSMAFLYFLTVLLLICSAGVIF
ncbi:MAG: stage III sporulation protein AE [Clostridia bacterium]|nr:stage III sporulation protein AE [Clostridia bacterium]